MSAAPHQRAGTCTLYGTFTVAIQCDTSAQTAVRDYFWPYLQDTPDADPVVWLDLGREPTPAQESIAGPGDPITLYDAPDGRVDDYNSGRIWPLEDGRVVLNSHTATYFTIQANAIAVRNRDRERGIVDLCRVIKQLAATHFEARGRHVLHAAAVEFDTRAVLFVGPKGAGKTTLVRAALNAGARFVANDRVFLQATTAPWNVIGWSDPMRLVNPGGAKKTLVALHSYFAGERARVCSGDVEVGLIVLPRIDEQATDIALNPVGTDVAHQCINEQILPRRQRWLGIEPQDATRALSSRSCGCVTVRARYSDAELALAGVLAELREPELVGTQESAARP